ncbi:ATP-binding/permease protein CydD [Klebsiella pneumoniae]|uniref:ATP-binding/permease protein CydD n=1 Tax=Klebsiella pneumoniae TaxID=573 RepID=A0ABD7UR01_KLEPN|nr:ATP-binding/permease protein CydD [Klebsiella pneumoniae]
MPCRLLLLDEPAASLTPIANSESCTTHSSEQTTLLVTHQLEGLADWDDVWVMQDGQIIEQGDYATLARAGGVFSALLAHRQEEI